MINTHGFKMPNGKHKDELITRVPVSYLRWITNTPNHSLQEYAQAELDRRGSILPEMELSGHAINRASFRCLKIWKEDRNDDEGLHSWLLRRGMEAFKKLKDDTTKVEHMGIKWAFEIGERYPVLKTVMKGKKIEQK